MTIHYSVLKRSNSLWVWYSPGRVISWMPAICMHLTMRSDWSVSSAFSEHILLCRTAYLYLHLAPCSLYTHLTNLFDSTTTSSATVYGRSPFLPNFQATNFSWPQWHKHLIETISDVNQIANIKQSLHYMMPVCAITGGGSFHIEEFGVMYQYWIGCTLTETSAFICFGSKFSFSISFSSAFRSLAYCIFLVSSFLSAADRSPFSICSYKLFLFFFQFLVYSEPQSRLFEPPFGFEVYPSPLT